MTVPSIPCPFVCANGRHCTGIIRRARAYGPARWGRYPDRDHVRKYRLWCSEKDDHAGIPGSPAGKPRMGFYPDQLPDGVEDLLWQSDLLS